MVDSKFGFNFKTVKDNSNLKQTSFRGIGSLHFRQISFRDPFAPLGEKICSFVRLLQSLCLLKIIQLICTLSFDSDFGLH